jgi:hypothetical protein
MLAADLETGLKAFAPEETEEANVINSIMDTWEPYAEASIIGANIVVPGTMAPGFAAMRGALVGVTSIVGDVGQASQKITDAVTLFWATVAPSAATIWVVAGTLVLSLVPPVTSGLKAALDGAFDANTAAENNLDASAAIIAAAWHPTNLGGLATTMTIPAPPTPNIPLL